MRRGHAGYDPLAAARAAEIDEVIESLAEFSNPPRYRVDTMFESLLLSYAQLRSNSAKGAEVTVLLGRDTMDRAKSTGLLAWCAETYPNLTFTAAVS